MTPATRRNRADTATVPSYALYGEHIDAALADRVHCESIPERSRIHGWEIRPHRHERLFQIVYIAAHGGEARFGDRRVPLPAPCLVSVPAGEIHGYRFDRQVQGWVLTLQAGHLAELIDDPALTGALEAGPAVTGLAGEAPQALAAGELVATIVDEYSRSRPGRSGALRGALALLLTRLGRALAVSVPAGQQPAARANHHAMRYLRLIERDHRQHRRVSDYATELGITATQLNRVCLRVTGRCAQALLHERLVLEARRKLAYSTMAVGRVGLALGFSDPAYFSRFFLRHTGMRPAEFRRSAGARALSRD